MPRGRGKKTGKRAKTLGSRDSLLAYVLETPGAKTSEIADSLGVGQIQVRNELMQMEHEGLVYRTGQTRGTRWYPSQNDATFTPAPAAIRRGPKERVLDDQRDLLGKMPDAEVAERTGASIRTIAAYRKKHLIAGYSGPRRRADIASDGRSAWKLEFRVGNQILARFTLGGDLGQVAQSATENASRVGGEVVGITWMGEAL